MLEGRQSGSDPFAAIETIVSWEDFAASITEAQKLAQPEDFEFLHRYAPELLDVLGLHAAPAAKPVLEAIEVLHEMNAGGIRELPDDAPLDFIRERWARIIFTDAGINRRYYELCALSELKNALRSGDILKGRLPSVCIDRRTAIASDPIGGRACQAGDSAICINSACSVAPTGGVAIADGSSGSKARGSSRTSTNT